MKLFKPFGSKTQKPRFGLPELANIGVFQGLCLRHSANEKQSLSISVIWNNGLKAHLKKLHSKSTVSAYNVLIVISAQTASTRSTEWLANIRNGLQGLLNEWIANQKINLSFKPALNVQVDGQRIGDCHLKRDEFISIFTPHMIRPDQSTLTHELWVKTSKEKDAKHLGGWYEAQSFLTLGNHWLDTYGIASLPIPAFVCIEKKGESFQMKQFIHYDGLLSAVSDLESPTPTILIKDVNGKIIYWLELRKVTPEPTHDNSKVLNESKTTSVASKIQTVLWNSGFLLQKIHFPQFMSGYEAYLSKTGELSFSCAAPIATLKVSGKAVLFTPHTLHFRLNGRQIGPHKFIQFSGDQLIQYHQMTFHFIDHRHRKQHKWPYLAEITQFGRKRKLPSNQVHIIGRRGSCQIPLPSKRQNKNIIWRETYHQQGTIPTKNGMIDKSNFSSDTILVASEHVELDLNEKPTIRNISRSCQVFLQVGQEFTRLPQNSKSLQLPNHARLFVGNHIFDLSWVHEGKQSSIGMLNQMDSNKTRIH